LILAAALAGCSSTDKRDTPKPSAQNGPQDPPPVDNDAPQLGKPKGKVPPSAMEKRPDTIRGELLQQGSPH
jgi:hypothetical protein